ncbi:MAG: DUF4097 domain-containing protein [Pyrinomonadaceae bacterium]
MTNGIRKFVFGCFGAALVLGVPAAGFTQTRIVMPAEPAQIWERPASKIPILGGETYEKAIAVNPDVNLDLCVVQGNLRINSWNRNEVRIFVKNGSRIGFKVREKSTKDGKPVWVTAIGYDPKQVNKGFPDCIWGEMIEIDVPANASIEAKGQETGANIDGVRKVWVKNIGGNISVRNVRLGVTALTYEGDVTVDASEGPMMLETSTGNITAFEVSPSEIGDRFKAKSASGAIVLDKVGHRQTEVNSISGSVMFTGEIRSGGSYILSTSNGSLRLVLAPTTGCQITAVYGYGTFSSEIPIKVETENVSPGPLKKVVGKLGVGGDALLRLTTNNGSITINKQKKIKD